MKGSPLIRALAAFLFIALAGVPLWKLTRANTAVAAPVQSAAAEAKVALRLTFSSPPRSFSIAHLGSIVWSDETQAADVTKTLTLAYPKEGVDLVVKVAWPAEAGDAAVRVRLTDPAGGEHDKTVWGRGEIEEVVTFP